jgi:hypothetical protein
MCGELGLFPVLIDEQGRFRGDILAPNFLGIYAPRAGHSDVK